MISRILKIAILFAVIGLATGCSIDRTQLMSHPSAVKPGDTVSVLLSDIYLVLSDTTVNRTAYTRDSLHLGIGMATGWSVLSSDFYVVNSVHMNQLTTMLADTSLLMSLVQDSLAAFSARKAPMTIDNGIPTWIAKKTFKAHGFGMDSIKVTADSVDKWVGYSTKIDLSVPKNTKLDTGFAVKALPFDSSFLSTAAAYSDSVWVKAIPIVCFVKLVATATERTDTLLYYAKSGPLPTPAALSSPFNYDKGDMTFASVNINKGNAVRFAPRIHSEQSELRITSALNGAGAYINISNQVRGNWKLRISDASGRIVAQFTNATSPSSFLWNPSISSGMYHAVFEQAENKVSKTISILR